MQLICFLNADIEYFASEIYVYIWKHYTPMYMSGRIRTQIFTVVSLGVMTAQERITGNFFLHFDLNYLSNLF